MKKTKEEAITLIVFVITIIILLLLVGISIATLTGENGLFSRAKQAKENYSVSSAKEKLQLAISNLMVEQTSKGKELKKEDLPKINSDEIDVRNTDEFPIEVICKNYIFTIDENYNVTYVGESSGTVITFTTEPESYTNQDKVKVLLKISNPKGIKSIQKPEETDRILAQGQTEIGIDFDVTANGTYILKVTDTENNEVIKNIVIDQIDKLAPVDFMPEVQKKEGKITIIENGKDAESDGISTKSGIAYYEYYIIDEKNEIKKYDTSIIENLALGTYKVYVIAYDKAGNSKKSSEVSFRASVQFADIAAGANHSFAMDTNGYLWACGLNGEGQVGNETASYYYVYSLVPIKEGTKFKQISTRGNHCLAIEENGKLWAWGDNNNGQLGDGTSGANSNKRSPVPILEETRFCKISAGAYNSLAIDEDGNRWAWGYNGEGMLGDGTTSYKCIPLKIIEETKFSKLLAGVMGSLGIDIDGNLWEWGHWQKTPIQTKVETKFLEISSGGRSNGNELGYFNLAIDNEGNLWTWGENCKGQLGDGTTEDKTEPIHIGGKTKFKQVSAGVYHSLALDINGNIWSWGYNNNGQLGDGTKIDKTTPVQITNGIKFEKISAGESHSIALDSDGNLWAWGYGGYGQLGDGTGNTYLQPTQI